MNTMFLILNTVFEMIMPSLFNKVVTIYKSLFIMNMWEMSFFLVIDTNNLVLVSNQRGSAIHIHTHICRMQGT
jgi:hypothetical protein